MLLVPHYIKASPLHGIGLYAAEAIEKGTPVWRYQELFDQLVPEAILPALPKTAYDFLMKYSYPSPEKPGYLLLEVDNGRFMNHSDDPNCENGVAIRDIARDEEITCDYAKLVEDYELYE
jgi:SET domain-containing protein